MPRWLGHLTLCLAMQFYRYVQKLYIYDSTQIRGYESEFVIKNIYLSNFIVDKVHDLGLARVCVVW